MFTISVIPKKCIKMSVPKKWSADFYVLIICVCQKTYVPDNRAGAARRLLVWNSADSRNPGSSKMCRVHNCADCMHQLNQQPQCSPGVIIRSQSFSNTKSLLTISICIPYRVSCFQKMCRPKVQQMCQCRPKASRIFKCRPKTERISKCRPKA